MFEYPQHPLNNIQLDGALVTPASDYMTFVLSLISALVISMAIIPVMMRLAPRLGMIDAPDLRKVHAIPIPRVGGVGIVLGALLPIAVMLPMGQSLQAFVIGALVLFAFGVLDDCRELGHYVKFVGQFIAVITVVYYGDVYVTWLPFMGGEPVAEIIGRPFTVIAMVGMINAINHSDGLDGLAGGESLLSLACIAWLAYLAGSEQVVIISMATIGGVFGFMRFNTYPARIFMGDGGSQFLGFTLGYLAVVLTQDVNPALSPALPALMLGLPIADIIAVFAQRIYKKMNWFRATRNHIHHRLLDRGFYHYESVMIVYSVQALLVLSAVVLPYESDVLIIGIYLAVVTVVFALIYAAERSGWQIHRQHGVSSPDVVSASQRYVLWFARNAYYPVLYGVALFLVFGAFLATDVPRDFAIGSAILFVFFLLRLLAGSRARFFPLRLLVYVAIAFIVYLLNTYQPDYLSGMDPITYGFFGMLVIGIGLSIRFSGDSGFAITPMDYLIVLVVLVLAVLASKELVGSNMAAIALKTIILFYASELVFNRMKSQWNLLSLAVLLALLTVGIRGLLRVMQ